MNHRAVSRIVGFMVWFGMIAIARLAPAQLPEPTDADKASYLVKGKMEQIRWMDRSRVEERYGHPENKTPDQIDKDISDFSLSRAFGERAIAMKITEAKKLAQSPNYHNTPLLRAIKMYGLASEKNAEVEEVHRMADEAFNAQEPGEHLYGAMAWANPESEAKRQKFRSSQLGRQFYQQEVEIEERFFKRMQELRTQPLTGESPNTREIARIEDVFREQKQWADDFIKHLEEVRNQKMREEADRKMLVTASATDIQLAAGQSGSVAITVQGAVPPYHVRATTTENDQLADESISASGGAVIVPLQFSDGGNRSVYVEVEDSGPPGHLQRAGVTLTVRINGPEHQPGQPPAAPDNRPPGFTLRPNFPETCKGLGQQAHRDDGRGYTRDVICSERSATFKLREVRLVNGELLMDWQLNLQFGGNIPKVLRPGDQIRLSLSGTAGGAKQERYIGASLQVVTKGFAVANNPPEESGSTKSHIYVGNGTPEDHLECVLTVQPDADELYLSLDAGDGAGGVKLSVYEWQLPPQDSAAQDQTAEPPPQTPSTSDQGGTAAAPDQPPPTASAPAEMIAFGIWPPEEPIQMTFDGTGTTLQLDAIGLTADSSDVTYYNSQGQWTADAGLTDLGQGRFRIDAPGRYQVRVEMTDPDGYPWTATKEILVAPAEQAAIVLEGEPPAAAIPSTPVAAYSEPTLADTPPVPPVPAAPAGATLDGLRAQAQAAAELRSFSEAEQLARMALAKAPDDVQGDGQSLLGYVLHLAGKYPEAEVAFREASTKRPNDDNCWNNLGNALYSQNKFLEAEAAYNEAVRLAPENAAYWDNLGSALFYQQKNGAAEQAYREAATRVPGSAFYQNDLGNALNNQGKCAEAEAAYREATRLDPTYALAFANLAGALWEQNRIQEAAEPARKALELGNRDHWIHEKLRTGATPPSTQ